MKLTKTLPPPWNRPLAVSTNAYRRYWTRSLGHIHGDMLAAVSRWVNSGAVVWDIGANMGVFSFASAIRAGTAGRVYAFEADVECASFMLRSQRWKQPGEAAVTICPFAVSEKSGTVSFEVSAYRSAASAIAGFGRFSSGGAIREVPAFSVDDLTQSYAAPTIIKIDVEGAENLVLKGARETLARHRPFLFIECSGGDLGRETGEMLRSLGYRWKPWLSEALFTQEGIPGGDMVAQPE